MTTLMMAKYDDDGDSNANCGIRDFTFSFYVCNDDDGNRQLKK